MKVLIAVDGSVHSQKVIDYLAKHRRMFVDGNEIVVIHVGISLSGYIVRHLSKTAVTEYYDEEAAKVIEPTKAQLAKHGITNYTVDARRGQAAEEIVKSANEHDVELIMMGTRGQGAIGRAIMGSVATKVVSESDLPVLLVQ